MRPSIAARQHLALFAALGVLGCGDTAPLGSDNGDGSGSSAAPLTYHRDARAIIETKCSNCHTANNIAPFAMTDFESVKENAGVSRYAIEQGTMPPWHANPGCNDYHYNRSLSKEQRETLLAYFDGEMLEGDPADYVKPKEELFELAPDLTLKMAAPYTPQIEPDDQRCFIIEWPETEPKFITGYQVVPGSREVVHHVIVYKIAPENAEEYRAMDTNEEGPGYKCFGGPAASESENSSPTPSSMVATWVPGQPVAKFPGNSGIHVSPSSLLVMQMHYNTVSAQPVADQTSLEMELADKVDNPAVSQLFTKVSWLFPGGMPIPANKSEVAHQDDIDVNQILSFTGAWAELDLEPGSEVLVHGAGPHMHQLGTWSRTSIVHEDKSETCLIEVDDWDFNWQGQYGLNQATKMNTGKELLRLACRWNNSQENQPFIDGKQAKPQDVEWGDGTNDEMCLVGLFITRP